MRRASFLVLALLLVGCRTGVNYPDPTGPRFAAPLPAPPPRNTGSDTLKVVTFNVEYAAEIDSALAVLTSEPELQDADLVLLQEMDEAGVRRIADGLGMGFVYYPAVYRKATERDFGNAVLSRWPIVGDEKVILPHQPILGRTQRIATLALLQVGPRIVRVYSVHLATPVSSSLVERRDQMRAVVEHARGHPFVILGGDLNSRSLGRVAERRGYAWPTKDGPRTVLFGRWDHILFKGLAPLGPGGTGTIEDARGASDHKPVWAVAVLGLLDARARAPDRP